MSSSANEAAVPGIDTSRPHAARVYDYYLGGKDNFAADREMAEKAQVSWPTIRTSARENRAFLGRAVRYLAGQAGIRQFLDIGAGLPSADNVHEIAQATDPSCRVVYVDNDPMVLAHARALLISQPEGRTAYFHADLRDPAGILAHPVTRDVLDFTQPIGLMLVGVLHLIPDEDKPEDIMATLLDALPPGSYLTASHGTTEYAPDETDGAVRAFRGSGVPFATRDADEFGRLAFTGLELVSPGIVVTSEWRPAGDRPRPSPFEVNTNGGVARKPS
jgi:hypothetical protein